MTGKIPNNDEVELWVVGEVVGEEVGEVVTDGIA